MSRPWLNDASFSARDARVGLDAEDGLGTEGSERRPMVVDMDGVLPPDPKASAYRRPIVKLRASALERLVMSRLRRWDELYQAHLEEWRLNRDFYDGTRGRMRDAVSAVHRDPPWKKRYDPNVCRHRADQRRAAILDARRTARFVPASDSLDDRWSAELADLVAKYQDDFNNPARIRREALMDASLSSMGWGQVRLDMHGGRVVGSTPEGVQVHEGIVRVESVPSHQMCADTDATWAGEDGLDQCQWVARRYETSRAQLARELAPDQMQRVHAIEQGTSDEGDSVATARRELSDPLGLRRQRTWSRDRHDPGRYEVIHYHQRRSDRFPHGLHAVLVNGRIVFAEVAPYVDLDPEGWLDLPFACFVELPVPSQFPGTPVMSLLRPMQTAINTLESSALEHAVSCAKAKVFMYGAGESNGVLNDQHAQTVRFSNPQARADVIDRRPWTSGDFTIADRAMGYMDAAAGTHDVSRGEGAEDRTAREASLLAGADQLNKAEAVERLDQFMRSLRRKEFLLIKGAYTLPRLIEVAGEDDVSRAVAFVGADLAGAVDYVITTDNVLPPGRAARLAVADKLLALGLAQPDEVRELLLGQRSTLSDTQRRLRARARRGASQILETGIPPAFRMREDHAVWVEVMVEILQSSTFDVAPMQFQLVFEEHLELRVQAATAAVAQAAGVQQVAQGGVPGEDKPQNLNESAGESSAATQVA